MAGDLWKPYGENTGNLVYLSSKDFGGKLYIVDAKTGEVLDTGRFDKKYEDGRYIYRFNKPGSSFNDVVVISESGEHTYIPDGGKRYEGLSYSQASKNNTPGNPKFDPSTFSTTISQGTVSKDVSQQMGSNGNPMYLPGQGNVAGVQLLDPNALSFQRTTFEFTDPVSTLRAIAAENKGQLSENYLLSLQQAGQLDEANAQQLINYLNTMSPLQLQMVGIENAFNQQQKLQAAETAVPGIADTLRGEIKNAQTLASGRLLRDAEDRALEQTARSAGADAAWTRGLGDDSLIGKRLSDQLSVSQRLGVMQQGQNYMNTAVQLANQTLMDTPNKAALSQQIPGTPQRMISDIAQQQWQTWNNGTTMSPESAQQSITQQRIQQAQFDENLQNEYNKYMYDIMAANTQAINTQAQDIVNDQANVVAAQNKSKAHELAALALQNKKIDNQTYQNILSVIEQTGTINMADYVNDWDKWYADYISKQNSNSTDNKSTNTTTSNNKTLQTTNQKSTNKYLVTNNNKSLTYGVNSTGSMNFPQRNIYFNENASYWEQFNSELDDTDLTGVF